MCLLELLFGLNLVDKAAKAKKLPNGSKAQKQAEDEFWEDAMIYDMMKKDEQNFNSKNDNNKW